MAVVEVDDDEYVPSMWTLAVATAVLVATLTGLILIMVMNGDPPSLPTVVSHDPTTTTAEVGP